MASLLPIDNAKGEPCYTFAQALRAYPRSKVWHRDGCWMAVELLHKMPQREEPTFAVRPYSPKGESPNIRIHFPALRHTQIAEWRMPRDALSGVTADRWRPLEFRHRSFIPWEDRIGGR